MCVGETLEENKAGLTAEVVSRMVREGLKDLTALQATDVIIAYEPVWAIGTGLAATLTGLTQCTAMWSAQSCVRCLDNWLAMVCVFYMAAQ